MHNPSLDYHCRGGSLTRAGQDSKGHLTCLLILNKDPGLPASRQEMPESEIAAASLQRNAQYFHLSFSLLPVCFCCLLKERRCYFSVLPVCRMESLYVREDVGPSASRLSVQPVARRLNGVLQQGSICPGLRNAPRKRPPPSVGLELACLVLQRRDQRQVSCSPQGDPETLS